jgi:tetratricopeptide (TPR) repeat protein
MGDRELTMDASDADKQGEAQRALQRAYALEDGDELAQALEACEAALRLAPHWAEAHNLRGVILDGLDRLEEAIAAYEQALSFHPEFRDAEDNLIAEESEWIKRQRESHRAAVQRAEPDDELVSIGAFGFPEHSHLAKARLDWVDVEQLELQDSEV